MVGWLGGHLAAGQGKPHHKIIKKLFPEPKTVKNRCQAGDRKLTYGGWERSPQNANISSMHKATAV